jgi:predicted nucleic acid-binding protein
VGDKGTETGVAGDLVLDAGALIALERGDREIVAILWGAIAMAFQVVIPATALAQVWRGGPRSASLARLVHAGEVDPLTEERAKEVGLRLGLRNASDVSDAHVACCASEHRAAVATSDPDDIQALAMPGERLALIPV